MNCRCIGASSIIGLSLLVISQNFVHDRLIDALVINQSVLYLCEKLEALAFLLISKTVDSRAGCILLVWPLRLHIGALVCRRVPFDIGLLFDVCRGLLFDPDGRITLIWLHPTNFLRRSILLLLIVAIRSVMLMPVGFIF